MKTGAAISNNVESENSVDERKTMEWR